MVVSSSLVMDHTCFYQDPYSYEPKFTESTPLGAVCLAADIPWVESFQLGSNLKSIYLDSSSPLHIQDMLLDPIHRIPPYKVHVHAKAGEGAVILDSSIALLQGMFWLTPSNKITIANGTTVVSPLRGYQYVPVAMVPDSSDNVLESWVDCRGVSPIIVRVRPALNGGRSYRVLRSTLQRSTTRSSSQCVRGHRTF